MRPTLSPSTRIIERSPDELRLAGSAGSEGGAEMTGAGMSDAEMGGAGMGGVTLACVALACVALG